jgi:hypothetical protein
VTAENLPAQCGECFPQLPSEWGVSEAGRRAITVALTELQLKHGLYAGIPMICLGDTCPYGDTCGLLANGEAPEGERCPKEVAQVIDLFNKYTEQLGIEDDNMVELSLVKELVDLDIKISRADRKQAVEPDLVKEVPVAVDDRGRVIRRPEVDKITEVKDKLMERRHKILSYLNATPKDKAATKIDIRQDPSSLAAQLLAKKQELERLRTIEVEALPAEDGDA